MGIALPCCKEQSGNKSCSSGRPIVPVESTTLGKSPETVETGTSQKARGGEMRALVEKAPEEKQGRGPEDYQHVKLLGRGSFGFVVIAEEKATSRRFAMKIIRKAKINESNLLQSNMIPAIRRHPFLVNICEIFQNEENIYIVMEYLAKGDLYFYERKPEFEFTENVIRDIMAEIIVAVDYLHKHGIVYRQLKPENILITDDGHIKITDYGLSKIMKVDDENKGISTFFGSLEYMAPEVTTGSFDQRVDLWAMGVLMYELKFKENPMENKGQLYQSINSFKEFLDTNVIEQRINSKIGLMSFQFRDLLLKLLEKDPNNRISMEQTRLHPFFEEIDWAKVETRTNTAPMLQLLKKNDYIKFRDPSTESLNRSDIFKRHRLEMNQFALNLYQIRKSQ